MIHINDKYFNTFIPEDEIQSRINALASIINNDYKGKEVLFIAVLNGVFMFATDLLKKIKLECEISFIKVSTYKGTSSTSNLIDLIGLTTDLKNKEIILLDDIVDTGFTLSEIEKTIKRSNPKSLKTCALLFKPNAFKGNEKPHYIGFEIPNLFVVGYGLDYNQKGRNYTEIYQITEN
jgi:hypoxanthine phosphoribosyltransferase